MIGHPCASLLVLDDFPVMSRSLPAAAVVDKHLMLILHQRLSSLIHIRTQQALAAGHNGGVGALGPGTAGTDGAEEIVIAFALIDITALVGFACYLERLASWINRQCLCP